MKRNSLIKAVFAAMLCSTTLYAADSVEIDSMSYPSSTGKILHRLLYLVQNARMEAQPAWNPTQQPIGLPPDKAAAAAVDWAQRHLPAGTSITVDEITLHPLHQDPFVGKWYYVVDLSHSQDKGKFDRYGRAVVLFDGTIVEPTE